MSEETKEDNKAKILFALAVLLGDMTKEQIAKAEDLQSLPKEALDKAVSEYAKRDMDKLASKEGLTNVDVQKAMAELGDSPKGPQYFKIENPGDGKTCEACRRWIGKVVSDEDRKFPSTQDWIKDGGLHPRCRCSLHLVDESDAVKKKADDYVARREQRIKDAAAFNSVPLMDLVFS